MGGSDELEKVAAALDLEAEAESRLGKPQSLRGSVGGWPVRVVLGTAGEDGEKYTADLMVPDASTGVTARVKSSGWSFLRYDGRVRRTASGYSARLRRQGADEVVVVTGRKRAAVTEFMDRGFGDALLHAPQRTILHPDGRLQHRLLFGMSAGEIVSRVETLVKVANRLRGSGPVS